MRGGLVEGPPLLFCGGLMGTRLQEIVCSICDKRVTPREDTCTDENRKAVHTDCYVQRILQGDGRFSGTAA